jgi:hypothetical protein
VFSPVLVSVSFLAWFLCINLNGETHTNAVNSISNLNDICTSSPKWIRGAVVSLYQWAITIGILLAAVINNATEGRSNHSAYQIPISIQFVWAGILGGGMMLLPEACNLLHHVYHILTQTRFLVPPLAR